MKKSSDVHRKMKSVPVDSVRYDVIEHCSKISDSKTLDIGVKNNGIGIGYKNVI